MPNINEIQRLFDEAASSNNNYIDPKEAEFLAAKIKNEKAKTFNHTISNKDLKHLYSPTTETVKIEQQSPTKYSSKVRTTEQSTKTLLSNLSIANNLDDLTNNFLVYHIKNPGNFEVNWSKFASIHKLTKSQAKSINHKVVPRVRNIVDNLGFLDSNNVGSDFETKRVSTIISGGTARAADTFVYNKRTKQYIVPTTSGFNSTKDNKLALSMLALYPDMNEVSFVSPKKEKKNIVRVKPTDLNSIKYTNKSKKTNYPSKLNGNTFNTPINLRMPKQQNTRVAYKEKQSGRTNSTVWKLGETFQSESPILLNLPMLKNIGSIEPVKNNRVSMALKEFYRSQGQLKDKHANELRKTTLELTSGLDYEEAVKKLKNTTVGDIKHISRLSNKDYKTSFEDYIINDDKSVYETLRAVDKEELTKSLTSGSKIRENTYLLAALNKLENVSGSRLTSSMKDEIFNSRDHNGRPTKATFSTIENMTQRQKDIKFMKSTGVFLNATDKHRTKIDYSSALSAASKISSGYEPETKKLLNLYTMENPNSAATYVLKNGIPKGYETFVHEGITNLQGNTRKDFMQAILAKSIRAQKEKTAYKPNGSIRSDKSKPSSHLGDTFKTIGGMLDTNTFNELQDNLLFTNRLKYLAESESPRRHKKYIKSLTKISRSLEDGFTEANPQIAKEMKNAYGADEAIHTFNGSTFNKALKAATQDDSPMAGSLQQLDNKLAYEAEKANLITNSGYTEFDADKEAKKLTTENSKANIGFHLESDNTPGDSYLDKVVLGDGNVKAVRKDEFHKLLKKKSMRDKDGKLIASSGLEALLRKIKRREASSTEILQLVNLGKALGIVSHGSQTTLGSNLYKQLFTKLYDIQANYNYHRDWATVSTNNLGESGKFKAKAESSNAHAKGKAFVDLKELKSSAGRVYFNNWNGEDKKDDWAWQKRDALAKALSRNNSGGYAAEMAATYRKEADDILSGNASAEQRSMSKEEYIQANKIQSLIRANGGILQVPFEDLDTNSLGKMLYGYRNPKSYLVKSSPVLVDSADYIEKKYKSSALRRIERNHYASTPEGKAFAKNKAIETLGIKGLSGTEQANRLIIPYKSTIERLRVVSDGVGMPREHSQGMITALRDLTPGIQDDPVQQAAVYKVIDRLRSETNKLSSGGYAKQEAMDLVWSNPRKTMASWYAKALNDNSKNTFYNHNRALSSDKAYNVSEVRNVKFKYMKTIEEQLIKAGLGEYYKIIDKSKRNMIPIDELISNKTKSASKEGAYRYNFNKASEGLSISRPDSIAAWVDKNKTKLAGIKNKLEIKELDKFNLRESNIATRKKETKLFAEAILGKELGSNGITAEVRKTIREKKRALSPKLKNEIEDPIVKWPTSSKERLKRLEELKQKHYGFFGSRIRKFATGGFIPGKSIKDEVPALLMKGETVLTQKISKDLGITDKRSFERFKTAAAEGRIRGYEQGGNLSDNTLLKMGPDNLEKYILKHKVDKHEAKNLRERLTTVNKFESIASDRSNVIRSIDLGNKSSSSVEPKIQKAELLTKIQTKLNAKIGDNGRDTLVSETFGEKDLKGHLDGSRLLDPSKVTTHEARRKSVSNINSEAMFMKSGSEAQKKLFKLQKDLIVSAFEENNPAKAVINEVFKSGIDGNPIAQGTIDKYNKLSSVEKNAVTTQLSTSIGTQELAKSFKPVKDLSNNINALNNNLDSVRKLTGLNEKDFNTKYGKEIGRSKTTLNSLVEDIDKAKTYQTKDARETTKLLGALDNVHAMDTELNNSQNNKDSLNAVRDTYGRRKGSQVQASGRIENFKEQIINNAAFMGSYAVLGAGTALITGTLGSAVEFQDRLKNLQAITGSSSTEMDLLTGSVKKVAVTTKFSASEIADAATILGQAGYTANSINSSLGGVVKLATATGSSLEDSTQTITSALTIWDKSFSESGIMANQFTAAVNKSKLDINTLGLALQYSGNIAAQGNIPVEDVLTLTSLMKDAGIKRGSTLGTGQRMLFSDIIAPSAKFAKSLKAANISLKDFNKVFNEDGVIGVFKFMKDSGYTFQHATRGMEVRERTAYAAISNQIDKAPAFRSSIIGTSAADDANVIQLSSTKNSFKNMVNSWAIGFYSEIEGSLKDSAGLFKKLTLESNDKKKTLYAKTKEDYIKALNPEGGDISGLGLGLAAAGVYGADYLSKGKVRSMATKGIKFTGGKIGQLLPEGMVKSATNLVPEGWAAGTKGAISKAKIPLIATALELGKAWSISNDTYSKTENRSAQVDSFLGSLYKSLPTVIGAAVGTAMTFGTGGLASVVAPAVGAVVANTVASGLGFSDRVDRATAMKIKTDAGYSSQAVIENQGIVAETYSEQQGNLSKSYKGITNDKALRIKRLIDTQTLSGDELSLAESKNIDIRATNEQKNLTTRKKALELEKQYSTDLLEVNNYLNSNFSFLDKLGQTGNNQQQLLDNIQQFKELSAKANSDYTNSNMSSNLKLYSVATQDEADKINNKGDTERAILTGILSKAINKAVNFNPALVTKNLPMYDKAMAQKAVSLNDKVLPEAKLTDDELSKVVFRAIKAYRTTANVSMQTSGDLEQLKFAQKDIKANGSSSAFFASKDKINNRANELYANKAGFEKLQADKGQVENLADILGSAIAIPLRQIDKQLRTSFSKLNRSLGIQANSFSDYLASKNFNQDLKLSQAVGDTYASGLDERLSGKSSGVYRKLLNEADSTKGHKQVLKNITPEAIKTSGGVKVFEGTDSLAVNKRMNLAVKEGAIDVAKLKDIASFVKNIDLPKNLADAYDFKSSQFARGLNSLMRNMNINKKSYGAVNSLTSADFVNMNKADRNNLINYKSQEFKDRQQFIKKLTVENMAINTANFKTNKLRDFSNQIDNIDIKTNNARTKLTRQADFNSSTIDIKTSRSLRDLFTNRGINERNLGLDMGYRKDAISRRDKYAKEDLTTKKQRSSDKINKDYQRNLTWLDRSVDNQRQNALIGYSRSIEMASINFSRAASDLTTDRTNARKDAWKNYARQVENANINYRRTLSSINRSISDTNMFFERSLQKPVTITVNADTLLALSDKMSDVSLAMDANKAKLNENTSAIKQWININKTKEDLVKEAYKEAYKASGGDVNSSIFNKTYLDYMDKNADKLIDVVVSQGVTKAQAGYDYNATRALTDPEYIKNQVSNPSIAPTTESAAVGNGITTTELVDLLYGIANGSYRTTTTVGDVTSAKGEMGAALFDLETAMVKFDISVREAGIKLSHNVEDAYRNYRYNLNDISDKFTRAMQKLANNFSRSMEDMNRKLSESLQDIARNRDTKATGLGLKKDFSLSDLQDNFSNSLADINKNTSRQLTELEYSFEQSMSKINQAVTDNIAQIVLKAQDSKEDLIRSLQFNLNEIDLGTEQLKAALTMQLNTMFDNLAVQNEQKMLAFDKSQTDSVALSILDTTINTKKYEDAFRDSMINVIYDSTAAKEKMQTAIDEVLKGIDVKTENINDKIQAVLQTMFSNKGIKELGDTLGLDTAEKLMAAIEGGFKQTLDMTTVKNMLVKIGKEDTKVIADTLINTVTGAANLTNDYINRRDPFAVLGTSLNNQVDQFVRVTSLSGKNLNKGFNYAGTLVTKGAIQSMTSMKVAVSRSLATLSTEMAKARSTSNRIAQANLFSNLGSTRIAKHSTGVVLNGYGGGDRRPVLLEDGEAVIRKEAVRALGVDYFNGLNSNSMMSIPKLNISTINNSNNLEHQSGTNFNITIPVAPDASLAAIERNIPMIADGVKKVFEEYL